MARPQRPRITPIAGPILGEFLIGISVAMAGLWMAAQISDATAGAFGMSQQVLDSLFVLFRVLAIGVGVTITQALGGRRSDAARRTALVGLGACTWVGAVAALWLLFFSDWTLDLLNAPDSVAALAGTYLPLLAVAALLEAYNLVMASILRAHLYARDTLFVMLTMHATHLVLAFPLLLGVGDRGQVLLSVQKHAQEPDVPCGGDARHLAVGENPGDGSSDVGLVVVGLVPRGV